MRISGIRSAVWGLALAWTAALQAQDAFPRRTVTIVVPYSAGGVTDHFARVLGNQLTRQWGQAVVVENRAGGGTVIGTQFVARAPADGYTLLFTSYAFTSNPILRPQLPYAPTAFRPVGLLGSSHNVLLVAPRLKGQSLAALLALARTQPGGLKLASSGPASSPHIGAEMFTRQVGVPYTHIPYKGQGPAMTDLISGVVDGMFDGLSSLAAIQAGQVAAVAIAAPQRHPAAPDIPTFRELGVDFVNGTWFGILAPAGTPGPVVARINAELRRALTVPEVLAQIGKVGMRPSMGTPEAFGEFLEHESVKLRKLVEQGARIESE